MIILDGNPNEQASVDSKVLEAEGQSELAPSEPPTTLTPAPPPYFPQPGLMEPQNQQTVIVSHLGPTSRQQPALKRFLKAFACALLIITLTRMLVWSVDVVSTREPHEWTSIHKPDDALSVQFSKPDKLGCGSGTVHPHCFPPLDPTPRRIVPIQYPPYVSRSKPAYASTRLAL